MVISQYLLRSFFDWFSLYIDKGDFSCLICSSFISGVRDWALVNYKILDGRTSVKILRNADILIIEYFINGKVKTRRQAKDSHYMTGSIRNI